MLIVVMWIFSRTVGVPLGPEAGEPERVGLPDAAATGLEVLLVIGALRIARSASIGRSAWPTGALAATTLVALGVAAVTAASLLSLVEL